MKKLNDMERVGRELINKDEQAVYIFALRYASGRRTYAHSLVIKNIIRHIQDFSNPKSFLSEIDIRRREAESGYKEWDKYGEEAEFYELENVVREEIERRKNVR